MLAFAGLGRLLDGRTVKNFELVFGRIIVCPHIFVVNIVVLTNTLMTCGFFGDFIVGRVVTVVLGLTSSWRGGFFFRSSLVNSFVQVFLVKQGVNLLDKGSGSGVTSRKLILGVAKNNDPFFHRFSDRQTSVFRLGVTIPIIRHGL